MNFLAHFHLSGTNEDIAIGNFLGDFLRGSTKETRPLRINQGIKLHQFIDHYTDTHPIVKQVTQLLQPYFSKYAPVVSDVYFDYFLANHFTDYSSISLREYTNNVYDLIDRKRPLLTKRALKFYEFLIVRDIFFEYGNLDGMTHVFNGLASKAKFESNMEKAVSVLVKHEVELYEMFKQFYPDLQKASHNFLNELLLENNELSK